MWLPSPTPDDTRAAGRCLGRAIGAEGAVVALSGPLGAGKTLFVKGLAEGLGLDPAAVSSPTFVIANEYPLPDAAGRVLAHVDLYRLTGEAELEATGFLDWLVPGNVVAVEWSDRLPGALPADRLEIRIEKTHEGSQRKLNAIASGPGAEKLLERWRAALEAP
ncbi:MAG: tRNA (adenosine(37)-N6)-threonylcarbamoyltransferase complex ATPase subunit type 1 TsaE [Myxococcota bacterium]